MTASGKLRCGICRCDQGRLWAVPGGVSFWFNADAASAPTAALSPHCEFDFRAARACSLEIAASAVKLGAVAQRENQTFVQSAAKIRGRIHWTNP